MKTKKSPISPELLARVNLALTVIDRNAANSDAARTTSDREIARFEATRNELTASVVRLKEEAITSDDAAGKLLQNERRLTEVQTHCERLKSDRAAMKHGDYGEAVSALSDVLHIYREAVLEAMTEAVAPFGYPPHLLPMLVAHADAMKVLFNIRDNILLSTDPFANHAGQAAAYLRRAARGQINLAIDETDQPNSATESET